MIVGHYDSVNGPAVFHRLNELRPGQSVQVRRADGSVAKFSSIGSSASAKTTSRLTKLTDRSTGPSFV